MSRGLCPAAFEPAAKFNATADPGRTPRRRAGDFGQGSESGEREDQIMVCFEVFLNGAKVCTAGVGQYGSLQAGVRWSAENPANRAEPWKEGPYLRICGHIDHGVGVVPDPNELMNWLSHDMVAGDEVLIRVKDADNVDPPDWRAFENNWASLPLEQKRKQFRAAKRHYERLKKEMEGAGEI